MNVQQFHRAGLKALVVAMLCFVGLNYGDDYWGDGYKPWWNDLYADIGFWLFWSGVALLTSVLILGQVCRSIMAYFRFQARVKPTLPGEGNDQDSLLTAAMSIHRQQEERALRILEVVAGKSSEEVQKCGRWMGALAVVNHLKRHRRLISSYHDRFPQTHGLVFSHGRVPVRRALLVKEWEDLKSSDLDSMAFAYLELVDEMIRVLDRPENPFQTYAESTLQYITGYSFLLSPKDRYATWWKKARPIIVRGGGALLVSLRLIQREYYSEAESLLDRLGKDGLLSEETETVRRMASFFAMAARPQWRLNGDDAEKFFRGMFYHGALEVGVLRFPTAENPVIVEGCKGARNYRDLKISFIEDAFQLWGAFNEELANPLSVLMKRLLNHKGRQCPGRLAYWEKIWKKIKKGFEEPLMNIMDGVAKFGDGDHKGAYACFEKVAATDKTSSTPLVNNVYIRLAQNRESDARALARKILKQFPKDAGACVALGRMFATQVEDTELAEDLFQRARQLERTSLEPLICLGEVKLMEGKYSECQSYFDRARELDPSSLEVKLGLSRMYMETKRYKLAIENLKSVSKDGKGDAQHFAHYLLYRAYRDMSEHDRAIEFLERVPDPFFREPDLLDDIAFHLESEQEYARARAFSERAMVLRAKNEGPTDGFEAHGEI